METEERRGDKRGGDQRKGEGNKVAMIWKESSSCAERTKRDRIGYILHMIKLKRGTEAAARNEETKRE